MEIGYKLVRITSRLSKFTSYYAGGQAEIVYIIDQEVVTPQWLINLERYPMLFESGGDLRYSVNSLVYSDVARVLICDCADRVPLKPRGNIHSLFRGEIVENFLSYPPGTVSYKTIIPRKVYTLRSFFLRDCL